MQPDLAEITPLAGDLFILCSDGLTTHLEDDEIMQLAQAEPDLHASCAGLVGLANQRGGRDNITVVLARFEEVES